MYPIHIKFVYLLSYTRKKCSYRNIHQPYMRNKLFLSDFNGSLSKIVYPSQPNWSTYEPYRMTINSLHHENDHQWNKNFKLNPSVTFFFFSCAFLLILFFCFIPLYRWMWSRGCRPRSVKRYQYVQCISLLTYFFDLLSSLY